jgi:hypothetical protein
MDAVERAVKTAAQTAVGLFVGLQATTGQDWQTFFIGLGVATGLSFVTSILSSLAGSSNSASAVK